MLRDEPHAIQPVIKVTVENVVRNLLSRSACFKEDLKEEVKSYIMIKELSRKLLWCSH